MTDEKQLLPSPHTPQPQAAASSRDGSPPARQLDLEAARRAAALGPNPLGPYAVRKRPAYSIT